MDAKRLKQIEEIYHAALEIPDGKRESFFKEFCGDDESLRREIETLLAFEKTFGNFIDSPPESLAAELFSEKEKEASLVNRSINNYKVEKLIGKGGMGEVYLAFDTKLERRVALKILPELFTVNHNRLNRFVQEAKAASALNHPNIITIYEVGEFESVNFIATEFIDGETLRDRLEKNSIPTSELLSIAVQTAEGLSAAHAAGIIHRDIKPENIMIRRDGYVKILDFGLAKLSQPPNDSGAFNGNEMEAATRKLVLTMPGSVMGTASYMSPEQTRGLADVDSRTDIWSLGVVIFEMLTRRTPFTGDTMNDVIASILTTQPPLLSKFITRPPAELERIVTKTLQKSRDERYQVIKDLTLDLKSLRKEMEFSAQLERVSYDGEKNITAEIPKQQLTVAENIRRTSLPKILLISLLTLISLGSVWWFFVRNLKAPELPEISALKTSEIVSWAGASGEIYSVGSFSPDGKMVAFSSTKTGGKNIWIKQTNSGESVQITKDEFSNEQPIWSPNGEELAFFSARGNQTGIWRIPILGGSPKLISIVEDGGSLLRYWSKQNLLYYESEHEIYAINVDSGENRKVTNFDPNTVNPESINISPDEKRVAYTTLDGETWNVWTKPLTAGAPKKLFSANSEIKNTVFHTDNQRIFYSALVDDTFQIFVTDINAAPPKQITFAERDCFVLGVAPDGTKILYGSAKEESDIWGVNLKDAKEFTVASDIDSELFASVSPDGKTIAYQSIKNLSQGNKISKGTLFTKKLNSDDAPQNLVTEAFLSLWSPDGKNIAYSHITNNKYQISTINAVEGGQKRLVADDIDSGYYSILPYNRLQTGDFSWSPDSSKIAYISNKSGQRNVWIVNADGSNETQLTSNNDSKLYFYCPLWSADGKRITFSSKTGNSSKKPTYSIWIIDPETKNLRMMTQQKTFFRLIGWMQNGKELILVSTDGFETNGLQTEVSLLRLEIETGKTQPIVALKDTYLYNIHLAPDGKNIAFAAHREGKDNIWLIPITGGAEKRLTNNNDSRLYFSSLAWSPDNNSIYFGKQSRYSLLSMVSNFK
jgi:eukaryotic-like serine/threonine-protein kinase